MTRQAYAHHQSKTVIFWSYKVACTSVVRAFGCDLLGLPDDGKVDPRVWVHEQGHLLGYGPARELIAAKGYRSIAMIRDPYLRLISAFLEKFVARRRPLATFEALERFAIDAYLAIKPDSADRYQGLSFREFASWCIDTIENSRGEPVMDGHWNTQVPFDFFNTHFRYDYLYPVSNSAAFFDKLSEMTGKPVRNRELNRGSRAAHETPAALVDVPSLEYCAEPHLHSPINFEDAALRAAVERAYRPDTHYFAEAMDLHPPGPEDTPAHSLGVRQQRVEPNS